MGRAGAAVPRGAFPTPLPSVVGLFPAEPAEQCQLLLLEAEELPDRPHQPQPLPALPPAEVPPPRHVPRRSVPPSPPIPLGSSPPSPIAGCIPVVSMDASLLIGGCTPYITGIVSPSLGAPPYHWVYPPHLTGCTPHHRVPTPPPSVGALPYYGMPPHH